MYNEQLEKLIEMALMDGELTEKEKQILFKKAEAAGIDLDEFEMVLDAKLVEKQVEVKNSNSETISAPKSDKFGDVRKCPSCAAILQSFQVKCSDCGHEFTNIQSVGSAQKLFDLLQASALRNSEKISEHEKDKDRRLESLSQKHNNESGFVKVFSGAKRSQAKDEEREDLIRECDRARKNIEKSLSGEKANIIKNFPVPNTKEDLLELMAMASSNAYDNDGHIGSEEEVWIQKTDQIYSKIKMVATNDTPFLEQATNMVVSLMKKLPKKYKKFTQIPENMRAKIDAELSRDSERIKEKRIVLFKKYGVWAGGFLLTAIIMLIIPNGIFQFIGILSIGGLIGTIGKFISALSSVNNSEVY